MQQVNFKTKKIYSGVNQDHLAHVRGSKGYQSNQWLTFLQAKELGYKVKKGEQGVKILKLVEDERVKNGAIEKVKSVRTYVVFNIEQLESK